MTQINMTKIWILTEFGSLSQNNENGGIIAIMHNNDIIANKMDVYNKHFGGLLVFKLIWCRIKLHMVGTINNIKKMDNAIEK